ncbi:MAG: FTR1 family iron permease [Selenomonadaceae bacterium]|nr:FTR1 family iron permease [Selenomonadaceae bacterium]
MKKVLLLIFAVSLIFAVNLQYSEAAPKWQQLAAKIEQTIHEAMEIYKTGDGRAAKDKINDAYYGIYEKEGMEGALRVSVSAKAVGITEYQFYKVKKAMLAGDPIEQVQSEADVLIEMVYDNVEAMENAHGDEGGWASFLPAFLILIREGLEAILVLVAIIAYLRKSGNEKYLDTVYNAMIAAILASFVTAYLFASIFESTAAGAGREILEGATALFAVIVLIGTSAWLGGKADSKVWKQYIQGMVDKSMTSGKAKALALAAFLAVYREGAEVILFYQALFNNTSTDVDMIWYGFGAGCIVIAILFFALQHGVLKIPLKPFFLFTSILMYLLAVSFAGSGIKELQEGGVLSQTPIETIPIPTIDIIGVYPTYETFGLQMLLIVVGIAAYFYRRQQQSKEVIQ